MQHALRITLAYEEDRIEVRSVRRLAMRVPAGQKPAIAPAIGQAVELRDGDGGVLYRRAQTLIPRTVEFPTGNADQPFGRVPSRRGIASVLVPADPRAQTVALVESGRRQPRSRKQGAKPEVHDLITIDLRDVQGSETEVEG